MRLKTAQTVSWIGPRPTAWQITAIVFVGTIGILIPGVQPVVLGALLTEEHINLAQLGHAASVELLVMGLTAALAAALLPPRHLRTICIAAGLVLALGDYLTPLARGETVTAVRAITGAAGGLLIWITASMIARSAAPDRWAGIYLTVQTLVQFIFAAIMTSWINPNHAVQGDFGLLAVAGLICAVAGFALPSAFVALPKGAGELEGSLAIPPPRGFAALGAPFLLMMCIVGIWVYYDPIAQQAGLSAHISGMAVYISLAFQVLGGTLATLTAGRLKWFPVFVICAAVDFGMIALLGAHPSALLFLVDAAVFGFIWLFILPFLVPMIIEADPSRRSAVLISGVALLGASLGPTLAGMIISPDDTRGALWFGAACLFLSLGIATGLRFVKKLPMWSSESQALRAKLAAPLGTRTPISYQRQFVDDYRPNQSALLPAGLADSLFAEGKMPGQQPAGTYARKVLEQLLIDLSWSSSRLEGNRMSLLDTRNLFLTGRSAADDADSTMLLNHKDAIEFIVDAVPSYGITVPVVRNLHSLLMQGLLANPRALGAIRTTIVSIEGSVYIPTQVPSLLEEMLALIVEKSRLIKNPIEAAFFLWLNLAYLQPFEDGNERTSRLGANLPLLLYNCAPLSFLDVDPADHAIATIGVYERLDVRLAVELFAWTYRRSIPKYQAVLTSMGTPDPLRAKYREHLISAVQDVVRAGHTLSEAMAAVGVPPADQEYFQTLLGTELAQLEAFNCARYRLTIGNTEEWIAKGRPA